MHVAILYQNMAAQPHSVSVSIHPFGVSVIAKIFFGHVSISNNNNYYLQLLLFTVIINFLGAS